MKKYTLLALICTAAAACGGGGGDTADARIIIVPDAPVIPDGGPVPDGPVVVDCDTVNQDCTDPVDSKCTVVCGPGPGGCGLTRTCLAPTPPEHANAGDMCLRNPLTGNNSVGHDDCAAGFWCSGVGFPDDPVLMVPTMRACRSWCRASTDCPAGNFCLGFTDLVPPDGFCLPSCDVFANPTTCTDGMACTFFNTIEGATGVVAGACVTPGPILVNGECSTDECAAGLICIDPAMPTCRAFCDQAGGAAGTHMCAAGTCTQLGDAPPGFGFCM